MSLMLNKPASKRKLVRAVTLAAIIITGFPVMIKAQTPEDSAAVHKQFEEYLRTFNTRDPVALSEFFTEDADFIMGNLPRLIGRKAIENWWRNYFAKQEPGRKGRFILKSLRFITADVALVNIETTTGSKDKNGGELRTRKARGTWVLHLQNNGKWLITAMLGLPSLEDRIIRGGNR